MEQLQKWIPLEYLIVAAIVLAVLFVVTLAFRALAGRSNGAESSRLGVSEYLDIDKHRRLVLIRRDEVEHLVLLGGDQDVVVETAIRPGVQRRDDMPAAPRIVPGDRLESGREHTPVRPRPVTRPVPFRAARPAVFGDAAPPPAAAPDPSDRAEPRLEPLKTEDKSREA